MLLVPVGLVSNAIAGRLHNQSEDIDSADCVFCGKADCDGNGGCLATISSAKANPLQS